MLAASSGARILVSNLRSRSAGGLLARPEAAPSELPLPPQPLPQSVADGGSNCHPKRSADRLASVSFVRRPWPFYPSHPKRGAARRFSLS